MTMGHVSLKIIPNFRVLTVEEQILSKIPYKWVFINFYQKFGDLKVYTPVTFCAVPVTS